MPANGTSSSPSATKHSRQQNPNPNKPPKVKTKKEAQAHQSTPAAATLSQNAGSKETTGKGKNKRTADVLSLFSEKEMSGGTIRLKPAAGGKDSSRKKPRTSSQGNWKERAEELVKQDESYLKSLQASINNPSIPPPGGKSPGPVITPLDDKDLMTLSVTNRPPHDEVEHVVCKHCKRPVIKASALQHVKLCLKAKTEKAKERKKAKEAAAAALLAASKGDGADGSKDEGSGEVSNTTGGTQSSGGKSVPGEAGGEEGGKAGVKKKAGAKKMAAKKATGEPKKTKKQKALEEKLAREAKPKKKKEKPAKPEPKPKAPVDVEKQCGVPLPNGLLCARSLTCKSHSMGAKRAVMGRSQPYDVLLAAYQRKNQAKQQKAAINASGPHPDEPDGPLGPVDSDEETELVMAAVARVCPVPLLTQPFVPVRKKYQYLRMRDMLGAALRPGGGAGMGGLFGGGGGSHSDGMGMGMVGALGGDGDNESQQGDGDIVMGGMGIGGQPMMRGGGGSSRGGGLFLGIGSSQGRGASVAA